MTMKFPHASVAQKLFVTKSSMEKSFFNSFILFSESALPRYESYTILAGRSRKLFEASVRPPRIRALSFYLIPTSFFRKLKETPLTVPGSVEISWGKTVSTHEKDSLMYTAERMFE